MNDTPKRDKIAVRNLYKVFSATILRKGCG